MSVEKLTRKSGETVWRVRWRQSGANRARTFSTRRDAQDFDAERRRLARAGQLAQLDAGAESLDAYVVETWVPTYAPTLAPKTRANYGSLYDRHISSRLGSIALRDLTPERISGFQAAMLREGVAPEARHKAMTLLGAILQRAAEAGRIPSNPQRLVRKVRRPKAAEVRPLAPETVEALRGHLLDRASRRGDRDALRNLRDATIISVLAYSGIRPCELRRLEWGDVGERTLIVRYPKPGTPPRSVRLLAPLRTDLAKWQLAVGRPDDDEPVFPDEDGAAMTANAFEKWRQRTFAPALEDAGLRPCRPYDLRHSFASMLAHEGRSAVYIARQLGHGPELSLRTYQHVIEEFEDAPRLDAETAIRAAREGSGTRLVPAAVRSAPAG